MKFLFDGGKLDVQIFKDWMRVRRRVKRKLNAFCQDRDYGPAIRKISIFPMILRPEWRDGERERRRFLRKQKSAEYRTWIDFEKVRSGPDELREKLLLQNIVEAVGEFCRKAEGAFAGERLIEDILRLFDVTRGELAVAKEGAMPDPDRT